MPGQMGKRVGLGSEPHKVSEETARIKVVNVVMLNKQGIEILRDASLNRIKPRASYCKS